MMFDPVSARMLALRVLQARYGPQVPAAGLEPDLAAFQRDAVARLQAALDRYRGAILADSVGLGKTHIGAAIARRALAAGSPVIIATPPSLRRQWQRILRDPRVRFASHATLSRAAPGTRPETRPGTRYERSLLIVVDEAHAFRNPLTRRYRALASLSRGARLLLITATPVNNSLRDLYWLLRLFAGDGTFAAAGVPDLYACFRHAERSGGPGRIPTVLAQVMVRRTRSLLVDVHGSLDFGTGQLRFPGRESPVPVRYRRPAAWRRVLRVIEDLELNGWTETRDGADLLLRMTLLRRAESSAGAAVASFTALHGTLSRALDAVARGLDPRDVSRAPGAPADQLTMDALLLRPLPRGFDRVAMERAARRDLERIAEALDAVRSEPDAKLDALRDLLEHLRGRPVVLFTEFRTTAVQLHRELRNQLRTGLVHGGGALLGSSPAARRTVIERFAPRANGVRPPPPRERIELLISTDVLAEGLDLQDAADVISYDLPWNPVRLIQRVGRIDRLGSTHERIRSYHFVPERDLERTLGLMRRLRRKLRAIDCTIGVEDDVLGRTRELAGALRGDAAALQRIERQDALTCDIEERLRVACQRAAAAATDGLPLFPQDNGTIAPETGPAIARLSARLDIPRPLARARGPVICVFLAAPGAQRALVLRGRSHVADDRFTGSALLAALDDAAPTPIAVRHLRAARRAAERAPRICEMPVPRPPKVIPALRRRLHALLERAPGGATQAECDRLDVLLRALQDCSAGTEILLKRHRRELGTLSFGDLCDRVESLLPEAIVPPAPEPSPHPPPAAPATVPKVLGVLLIGASSG
ncbi:MAG TPA: helicase-related protein [Longimicrobiales bacterium]|nr:helicase-related protein [Longimicrobiales bacterium]